MCLTIFWTLGVNQTLGTILAGKSKIMNKNDKIITGMLKIIM